MRNMMLKMCVPALFLMIGACTENTYNYYTFPDGVQGVAAPVDVYRVGNADVPVATTTLGSPAIELRPGEYRAEVRTEPPQVVRGIVLGPGEAFTLELGASEEG